MTTVELGELPPPWHGARPATLADIQVATLRAERVPTLRGTRDYGMVLHQIRALIMFACFMMAACAMMLGAITYRIHTAPSGAATIVPLGGRSALQLYVPGPDPAADYYAHVAFADGTERDVQIGAYLTERPVRIEFAVTAPQESETSCRIVLDGVHVAQESAAGGRTAVCRWSAP